MSNISAPQRANDMTAPFNPPLGLYIHLPWCERKCPYCDFNSHALSGPVPEADYVAALEADLGLEADRAGGRRIESVFIGGGTPSLFSGKAIGSVLEAVDRRIGLAQSAEITLEANPGSAEAARFRDFRQVGVNRLSIGVQSFNDQQLQAIGRIHSAEQARKAVDAARAACIERLNLDLMYGLPAQSPEAAVADLEAALALAPDHLSHYELTLEPNTVFHSQPPALPDEDQRWDMLQACSERMKSAGLERYEISAWARPGSACRHNLNYWQFGDYLAIGAGAHGKVSDGHEIWRYRKHRVPQRFMSLTAGAGAEVSRHALSTDNRLFEFMLNALRLVDGFSLELFRERTGLDPDLARPGLRSLAADGLMETDASGEHWRPSERGLDLLNECQARFLPKGT